MSYQPNASLNAINESSLINSDNAPVSSAGITLSRLLLTLFNGILIILGCILVVVGISAHNHLDLYTQLVDNDKINTAALTLIITGIICTVTSMMSYFAARRQSVCLLYFSSFILLILFLAVTVGASTAVIYHGKIDKIFRQGMNHTLTQAYWEKIEVNSENQDLDDEKLAKTHYERNQYMKIISNFQQKLHCCGIDSYHDWSKLNKNFPSPQNVPNSCCISDYCGKVDNGIVQLFNKTSKDGTILKEDDTSNIYTHGCYKQITEFVSSNAVAVVACSYGLAVFQLIGIIFSCCLSRAIQGAEAYRRL